MPFKVTAGVTAPLDLPSCQIRTLYLMNWRCSDNGNMATCREVRETMVNFAPLYLENGKSYWRCKHPWPFDYKAQCSDLPWAWRRVRHKCTPIPKNRQKWGISEKWPLFGKMLKFCFESFHDDTDFRVHILRKSSAGKWVKRCVMLFCWQNLCKIRFTGQFWLRAPKVCKGECHVTLRLRVKFRPSQFRFDVIIPIESDFVR